MKTIFVVDDNSINLIIAKSVLSEYYEVITMSSAATMFEILESLIPDIILLDIMMPDITGFDALEQLKADAKYAEIPVIFLSGRNDDATKTHGLKMGAADLIEKPFSRPVLLERIKTILDRKP